jgi:hypothetical protein
VLFSGLATPSGGFRFPRLAGQRSTLSQNAPLPQLFNPHRANGVPVAAQFNGIVSGGPKPSWGRQGHCAHRPSGYNSLQYQRQSGHPVWEGTQIPGLSHSGGSSRGSRLTVWPVRQWPPCDTTPRGIGCCAEAIGSVARVNCQLRARSEATIPQIPTNLTPFEVVDRRRGSWHPAPELTA